ncbi:MAG: hypothetical protein QM528_02445 [Phycisphaerales bacterium]|nr:hypothetical protein [Phycisphaerales bacterium]
MKNDTTFSEREGLYKPQYEKPITIRQDAPKELREFVIATYKKLTNNIDSLRSIVTEILGKLPNKNNFGDKYILSEVEDYLYNCTWYKIYDIIETIILKLANEQYITQFSKDLNIFFIDNGIGWQIKDGKVVSRGNELFEAIVEKAKTTFETANLPTSKKEIEATIACLSNRPSPDITGAIQHARAGLECVARKVTGDNKSKFKNLMKVFEDNKITPQPLPSVIKQIYGFASNAAVHVQEGQTPKYAEAVLVVHLSVAISTYLTETYPHQQKN